jgi:O-antigen/teichoic acid export membrane protein
MRTSEKLISNTIYMFLTWFAATLFPFFFWFLVGKWPTLKPSDYGVVATSLNFVILISGFILLGINSAHVKLIPTVLKRRGMKGVNSLVRLSMKPLIIFLLFFSVFIFVFSDQLSIFLKIPHDVIFLNILCVIVYVIFTFFGSVSYSLQRMRFYFKTEFFQFFFRVIFGIVFLFIGLKSFGLLLGFFLSYFLFLFFRLDVNYFKENEKLVSYKKLFDYALPALIITITWAFIVNGQYILLTTLKNTEITGIFAVAFISTSTIGMIPSVLNSALLPIISELSADHKTKDKQSHLIFLVLRYALFLIFPISILLFIFSSFVVLLMSKPDFIASTLYFPILIPAAIFYGLGSILFSNIYVIGYPKKSRNISIVTSLLFLLISIPLINYFSATGLSFAYLISMTLFFVMSFTSLRKLIKIKFPFGDSIKVVLASLIVSLLLYLLRPFVNSFVWLIPLGIINAAVYLLVLLYLRFYRIEDVKILEFLSNHLSFGKIFFPIINFLKDKIKK